jgi:hypothetical protein
MGDTISYGSLSPYSQTRLLLLRDVTLPLPPLPAGSRMLGGLGMVVFHCFTGWQSTSVARTVFHYR